jgi:hypothetical protein
MAGWTKYRAKLLTLAVALFAAIGAEFAAMGQTPAGEPSGPGNSHFSVPGGAVSGKPGTLSGRLTDLHSRPLDSARVVLRNTRTGAEARTVTQKNGSYRFTGLPAGEYTLIARSERFGQGSLEGIFVSPGAEARVQAAMDLTLPTSQAPEAAGSRAQWSLRPGSTILRFTRQWRPSRNGCPGIFS